MRKSSVIGLAAASVLALASCTGGGAGQGPSPTATTTGNSQAKAYTEDELRDLISGMKDAEGNELKLYSKEQVDQGGTIAEKLMTTATVEPEDCKSIATAGLLDEVENGDVAVAVSESAMPRTLSAQSSSSGPAGVELLREVKGKLGQCSDFTIEVLGQRHEVSSESLEAKTNGEETFATVSTRNGDTGEMLMQVSAAEGRLLVVATKTGADLRDPDREELEGLVNEVLAKAGGDGTATASPTRTPTRTASPTTTTTASPTATVTVSPTETEGNTSPSPSLPASPTATR
ncbi:hypothetical protein F8G81_06285 [Arthrobacter sp. CDRTa11]|uniref:hypothetical protein n=1 Tax=Arthrobacter sp. CDRTa11 TaxID=2651199 RepID=UPI002265B294|nr:hypothetical protein [Arthrobacter sp. CDRTa11]UZX02268.1 hypothetical protein F8G81_06285 [Arthrobacter sp. CDRTa11]